jgi:hypothetical protein
VIAPLSVVKLDQATIVKALVAAHNQGVIDLKLNDGVNRFTFNPAPAFEDGFELAVFPEPAEKGGVE